MYIPFHRYACSMVEQILNCGLLKDHDGGGGALHVMYRDNDQPYLYAFMGEELDRLTANLHDNRAQIRADCLRKHQGLSLSSQLDSFSNELDSISFAEAGAVQAGDWIISMDYFGSKIDEAIVLHLAVWSGVMEKPRARELAQLSDNSFFSYLAEVLVQPD
jgi:hypothetical protein